MATRVEPRAKYSRYFCARNAALNPSATAGKKVVLTASDEPLWTRADYEQLKQVLLNLLINGLEAIEGAGEVTVRPVAERAAGSGGRVGFEVRDTGVGIPEDIQDRVFEPFFRAPETSHGKDGLGLSLAIVQALVGRLGGQVLRMPGSSHP